ncbi:unnamed protein product, partial [Polarella glacialis]
SFASDTEGSSGESRAPACRLTSVAREPLRLRSVACGSFQQGGGSSSSGLQPTDSHRASSAGRPAKSDFVTLRVKVLKPKAESIDSPSASLSPSSSYQEVEAEPSAPEAKDAAPEAKDEPAACEPAVAESSSETCAPAKQEPADAAAEPLESSSETCAPAKQEPADTAAELPLAADSTAPALAADSSAPVVPSFDTECVAIRLRIVEV